MKFPRFMIGAASSGSGKTLVTCGMLQALINRGMKTSSFKCGPDYIDPMFHSKVIGAKSRNLDTFFTDENTTKYLFGKTASTTDISVIEGVMGFYDGLGGISVKASAYDLAKTIKAPVILVVNTKGMSISVLSVIKGFMEYKKDSNIKGVILNQMSKSLYPEIKKVIEQELKVPVVGYVPVVKDCIIESRHLGLVTPDEVADLSSKLNDLANIFEETIDIDKIIALANEAEELEYTKPSIPHIENEPVVAVARDEVFCFYYEDNIELLKQIGAKIVEFSPLHDAHLPKADALILGGGYPELAAKKLSQNKTMLKDIHDAVKSNMPCIAECGGFMYLHNSMEDMEKVSYKMAGVIDGKAFKTDRLNRFGYIELTAQKDQLIAKEGTKVKGHEFHYFDSTACGDGFKAQKPLRKANWECINGNDTLAAGFPHLYYYSNIEIAVEFLQAACKYKDVN